jgi:lipooligosaccharide transport system permease protein
MAWSFALRQFQFWLVNYRRTWRGSAYSSVLAPVLYLGAMGIGLGTLINAKHAVILGGVQVSYLQYLAPGMIAAAAMQFAVGECTWPVLGSVKWLKTYFAAAATPLGPRDLFHGHLLFVTMRLAMNSVIFLCVALAFGAFRSPTAIAAVPAAVLTGLAFAAPVEAYAMTCEKDTSFILIYRFGVIPLFLFSGTFFPVSVLPAVIRPLAYVTPLWHGVALCQQLSFGIATPASLAIHVGFLAAFVVGGMAIGYRTYRRRLYV